MKILNKIPSAILLATILFAASCSDSESYSNLLRDEEQAVNWWLANHKVETEVPADSVFLTGKDAPFYKIDPDGYLYMQVVNPGEKNSRPEKGDLVYFRYMRQNIKYLYEGIDTPWEGNGDNMSFSPASFIYGGTQASTSDYGSGIQTALTYLGYNSEVNLVLQSYYGFIPDQSGCLPYIINVRYFKAEY